MKRPNKQNVKPDDTVICMIDEWNDGTKSAFDGAVISVDDEGVEVIYLSGYRSRNDKVKWEDVKAKVDERKPWVDLRKLLSPDVPFTGHFQAS